MLQFPECKINLGLSVTEKRSDGFHNLETVMYPVKLYDVLEIVRSTTNETHFVSSGLKIDGDPNQNLVVKAWNLLRKDFNIGAVNIHLHKVIPLGAGLGGGSSDAAYTLKMLNDIFELNLSKKKLSDYASQLGSDCSFFIESNPVFASARGEILENIQLDLSQYYFVIVKPDIHINTAAAYSWIKPTQNMESVKSITQKPIEDWKDHLINDFEAPVFKRYPEIKKIKNKLYDKGASYASMSGSGSAVFGIFNTRPDLDDQFRACFVWQG